MKDNKTADARAWVRLSALSILINDNSAHNTNYRGDIVCCAAELAFNDSPCVVVIRNYGYELTTQPGKLSSTKTIFGEQEGVAEWYYGQVEWVNKRYSYKFRKATADECIEFLKENAQVGPFRGFDSNDLIQTEEDLKNTLI